MLGLVINIQAGATVEESSVTATGQQVHIIAKSERASFGIGSDADLKRAVKRYFGKEPEYAYLKSPTPFGDLYKRFGWSQVQTVLRPIRAQILGIKTKPSILSVNTLKNESSKKGTFTTSISEQVTDTVSSEWSNSSRISAELTVKYSVGFPGASGSVEAKFAYEQEWGSSKTVTKQMSTGMEAGVTVDLEPRQSAIVELCASSGTMQVRITYEAYLRGCVAVHYKHGYKGYYYWGLPIGRVLDGSNKVTIVEEIEVGFYSNASVTVKNAKTNEDMVFYMADHPNEPESAVNPSEPPSADNPSELPSNEDDPDEDPFLFILDEPSNADHPVEAPSTAVPDETPGE